MQVSLLLIRLDLQVKGKVIAGQDFQPLPPEPNAQVDVFLHLDTHFGQHKVLLKKEQQEQDAQALKARLASGGIADQLQRAILWAASCLVSANDQTQKTGAEILNIIDNLERWCCLYVMSCNCLPGRSGLCRL